MSKTKNFSFINSFLFTLLVLCLGLGGCSAKGTTKEKTSVDTTGAVVDRSYVDEDGSKHIRATLKGAEDVTKGAEDVTKTVESAASTSASVEVTSSQSEQTKSTSSIEYAKAMGAGYNLGNEFDAYNCTWLSDEMAYESAWSKAVTTKEFIHHVKELGFTSIRIPVSWHNHVDQNFTISKQWLDRVDEVVSWAYDEGLIVVLNIHHDIDRAYIYPSYDCYESSKKYLVTVWKQLAIHFAGYGDRLVFEAMNEPRLVGETYEWWVNPSDSRCKEAIDVVNKLNQDFVDCVRGVKGNEERFLMIPSYCDMYECGASGFVVPNDSAFDKLLFTFHAYLPYKFAQVNGEAYDFGAQEKKANDDAFDAIYDRFVKCGVGVVLGEFGAIDKGSDDSRLAYFEYVAKLAKQKGMAYMVWDNNSYSGDAPFGLIDRAAVIDKEKEILDVLVK